MGNEQKSKNPELPRVTPQDITDLYGAAARAFDNMRERTVVHKASQLGPWLIESLTLPYGDGKTIVLSRERPMRADSPTEIAYDAPTSWGDASGKNLYHTPINIRVLNPASGEELDDIEVADMGSHNGSDRKGYAHSLYAEGSDDSLARLQAKELSAAIEHENTWHAHPVA